MCEVAKKIKNRREQLGLTLEEVGQAVGVGKSTVLRWENGNIRNMRRDKIAALAKILKISPVELVPGPGDIRTEDVDILEAYHQDPRLRLLFDRSRKMSDKDKDKMVQILNVMFGEPDGE